MDKAIKEVLTEAVLLEIMRGRPERFWEGRMLTKYLWGRQEVFLPRKEDRKLVRVAMLRLVEAGLVQQVQRGMYRLVEG